MTNEKGRRPDPRRVAMERDRKRSFAAADGEQQNKRENRAPKPPKQGKKPAKKPSASKKIKLPAINTKKAAAKVKNGFQVITGGKKKRWFRLGAVVCVLLAVILLINAAVPITLGEYLSTMFAGAGKGKGFPITVSTSEKSRLLSVGSDTALLGDSSVMLYKNNGKLLCERQHGFAEPAAVANTARIMVYDRGGKKVRMENRAKTLFAMEAKGPITTAAMSYDGHFALVTRGNNYVSEVTVYNYKAKEEYIWHSASRQVVDAALSENGRYLGVVTLHVEGGEAVTGLLMFDTKKGTTLFEQTVKGSTPISASMKKNTLMALLNDRVVSVTKTGEKAEHLFGYGQPICFDDSPDYGLVVVVSLYENANQNRMVVLDRRLSVLGQANVDASVGAVSAKDHHIALLSDQQVLFYNHKGVAKKQAKPTHDAKGILCKGNHAIVLGSDRLSDVKK